MFCENCGAPVLDDAKFCPACGEPVNATSAAASEPQPVQIQPAPAPQPAPQGAPTPPPMPGAVELDRNFGMILLLAIVTCGIYGIYAYYKISEDVATMCSGDGDDMPNYLIAILLSFITCGIYGLWWTYRFGNRIQHPGQRSSLWSYHCRERHDASVVAADRRLAVRHRTDYWFLSDRQERQRDGGCLHCAGYGTCVATRIHKHGPRQGARRGYSAAPFCSPLSWRCRALCCM